MPRPDHPREARTIKQFYDMVHETYFPIAAERRLVRGRTIRCLTIIEKSRSRDVLEIGFEDPRLSKLLADRCNYVGIDISEMSVKAAVSLGLRALALDVSQEEIPFDDGSFDLVYCSEVMEHLLNPDFALTQIKRVLRPGGRLLITTPNLASWYNRIIMLFGIQPIHTEVSTLRILGRKFRVLGQGSRPVGHIRPFTLHGLLDFLSLHGLRVIQIEGYCLDLPKGFGFIDSLLSRFPPVASGFIILAAKSTIL